MNQAYPPLNMNNTPNNQMDNSLANSIQELNLTSSDDDWEYVSSNTDVSSDNEVEKSESLSCKEEKVDFDEECSMIHRCESTPEFSSFSSLGSIVGSTTTPTKDDDTSYVLDCDSSFVDAQSISTTVSDAVLLSKKKTPTTTTTSNPIKKVPSFKDMVASNAEQLQKEERQKKIDLKAREEKRREDALQRRKAIKTRLVVTPIKRCARSTGDLRSLVIHEDEEGHGGGGGGGGGCMSAIIQEDEEILGESDAAEYYNRKAYGSKGRANGRKIRPDEKKRKDFIIHKKNAQRKAQGVPAKKKG